MGFGEVGGHHRYIRFGLGLVSELETGCRARVGESCWSATELVCRWVAGHCVVHR